MNNWLDDLLEEYPTKRSDGAIMRMVRVFSEYDDDTMRTAVDAYMLEGTYFPKVSDLHPYILHALYAVKQQGPTEYEKILQMNDDEIAEVDARMLAWEQERGTMPDDTQLDSEYEEREKVAA